VKLVVGPGATELAALAAELFRQRVAASPTLAMAVPAGRTPRPMYALMRDLQRRSPIDYSAMRVFAVDELVSPAPADGHFWGQVRREFLSWARVSPDGCHPFRVDEPDLVRMCDAYEAVIERIGGLDLIMLGLGPNGHVASNEPGTEFSTRTRPVRLLPATAGYILTDTGASGLRQVIQGDVSPVAVTLGMATILAAREVVVLVSGTAKRAALRRLLEGPTTVDLPASVLHLHGNVTVLADRDAVP
jgi:glucosamine-6-phosphate deaminase